MYSIFERLLQEHGVTAYRVGKETGISTATLTDWKKGRSTPKADKMQKIADYFGVSVDYLLGNTDEKKEPAPVSQGGHSKTALAFAEEFKDFGPEEWKKVREYAELLKSAHNKKGSE